MKARDRVALAALRSALAAIDNAEAVDAPPVPGGSLAIERTPVGVGAAELARRELTEADVERIVRADIDQREEAARGDDLVGRPDPAARPPGRSVRCGGRLGSSARSTRATPSPWTGRRPPCG